MLRSENLSIALDLKPPVRVNSITGEAPQNAESSQRMKRGVFSPHALPAALRGLRASAVNEPHAHLAFSQSSVLPQFTGRNIY